MGSNQILEWAWNLERTKMLMWIGLTSSLRMVGPTMGYTLARVFLSLNAKVTETTTLKPSDPAWIGAWWLGMSSSLRSPISSYALRPA